MESGGVYPGEQKGQAMAVGPITLVQEDRLLTQVAKSFAKPKKKAPPVKKFAHPKTTPLCLVIHHPTAPTNALPGAESPPQTRPGVHSSMPAPRKSVPATDAGTASASLLGWSHAPVCP